MEKEQRTKKEEMKGLKKLRRANVNHSHSKPLVNCQNCKCLRYSPCGCQKK